MIPLALLITNFRSVRGTQTFHFPHEPGLYFMQGVNEAEPRLEANGAGKTTVWEALTWCYFGKTSRGLKAGEVCNWEAGKGTEVRFLFLSDAMGHSGQPFCMTRTWSPNSWTLNYDDEDQPAGGPETVVDLAKEQDNPALAWLGLDFDQWLHCVLMAQNQPMFLDLKRDAQAAVFSAVVGADRWLDYSTRSGKMSADEDRRVRDMERELAGLQGELDATGRRDYKSDSDGWAATQQARLLGLEEQHADGLAKLKALKDRYKQAQDRVENARAWVARSQIDAGLEKDYQRAQAEVSDYELLRTERKREAEVLMEQVQRYLDLRDGKCPVCGSRASAAHMQREINDLTKRAERVTEEAKRFVKEMGAAQRRVEVLGEDVDKAIAEQGNAITDLDDAKRACSGLGRELDDQERWMDQIEEKHERLKAERNPYADLQERAREDARRLHDSVDSLQARLDTTASRQSLFQFWVRGFKDLRLSKIDEALTELEIEVNSGVDALGLLGWELQFAVDRETKAGKIERGFNCLVRSPHNDAAVPWEAWSGGEAQRLRLAGTMGLSDLIRSRTGASIPLEVWDEPTKDLSPQGIRDLLECLRDRAVREGRVIFLVDHRSHSFGGFTATYTIVKDKKGTKIICP